MIPDSRRLSTTTAWFSLHVRATFEEPAISNWGCFCLLLSHLTGSRLIRLLPKSPFLYRELICRLSAASAFPRNITSESFWAQATRRHQLHYLTLFRPVKHASELLALFSHQLVMRVAVPIIGESSYAASRAGEKSANFRGWSSVRPVLEPRQDRSSRRVRATSPWRLAELSVDVINLQTFLGSQ